LIPGFTCYNPATKTLDIKKEIHANMRMQLTTTILICGLTGNIQAAESTALADEADRINYTIGHQIGTDFKRQQLQLDAQALKLGIEDGTAGTAPLLERNEMTEILVDLKRKISNDMKQNTIARVQARKKDEEAKRSRGKAFMLENQAREGVKTLPSGLQYKVLSAGAGKHPEANDLVTFNYRARTLDGKEYDSSYRKGKPATRRANGVIPGFTEAIQMMRPGARWVLYLPPELAYGRQGPLAHQTVIIDVELLSIGSPEQAQTQAKQQEEQ
jgi:FKBP-type peptidyl-prolyl cis-trans isomerase FklB